MKTLFSAPVVIFFVGLAATAMLFGAVKFDYGQVDFFQKHGILFLVAISFFPRLTLLLSSVATGGILWWISFFFYPRLLIAVLATVAYLQTNPVLVYISWVVAISGEVLEKKGIHANKRFMVRHYGRGHFNRGPSQYTPPVQETVQGDVIEAEFTRKHD